MFKRVEFAYTEATEEKERLKRIAEILSEGVYAYLKKSGLLREDLDRTEMIKRLLEETKVLGDKAKEEIEREDS